jgi:hypothetical protein
MKIQLNQASDQIQIVNAVNPAEYIVYNSIGGIVAKGQINQNKNKISIQALYNGYYVLVLKYDKGGMSYLKFEKN